MDDKCKKKCQIFTPRENVIQLLNWVGYKKDLYGKKVLENSCGDGQILMEVVERYIKDCLKKNIGKAKIKEGLEQDIYGVEIDKIHYDNCIKNLNAILNQYKIENVKWNILQKDILQEKLQVKFDFVVGNPPYIKYRLLNQEIREFLKNNYQVCSIGKFDYCYAFIESGIESLNTNGKMAYLIPSSIFKNVFAKKLREYMKKTITDIYDYTTQKLFTKKNLETLEKDVLTSSAVIIIDKTKKTKNIKYHDIVHKKKITIEKKNLGDKWVFFQKEEEKVDTPKKKFGDLYKASNTIATLYNNAFVIQHYEEDGEYIITKDHKKIEKGIIKIAASPRNLNKGTREVIIFPYYYEKGELKRYKEKEIEDKFPNAYQYLKSHKEDLFKRKSDHSAKWYEYGRSQAITQANQKKLLLSTVITKEVKIYELNEETVPYSGIYITTEKENLREAKEILESEDFLNYVKNIGINASGESIRITSKDVNNYRLNR